MWKCSLIPSKDPLCYALLLSSFLPLAQSSSICSRHCLILFTVLLFACFDIPDRHLLRNTSVTECVQPALSNLHSLLNFFSRPLCPLSVSKVKVGRDMLEGNMSQPFLLPLQREKKKIKLAEHVTLEINFERVSVVSGKGGTKRERPCMACEAQFWLTDTFYTIFACLKSLHQQLIVYIWRALQPWAYFQPVIYCSALGTLVTLCKSSTVFPFSCFKDGEEPVVEEGWGLWWCSLGQTGGGDREEHN